MNPLTGTLTLNGVRDGELVRILEVKMRHEHSLNFNPQQMQIAHLNQPPHGNVQVYNNVVLGWTNESGLQAVQEIVHYLLKKEEKPQAQGQ